MDESEDYTILLPNPIKLKVALDGINCVKFHPSENLLALGTEEGRVRFYKCDEEDPPSVFQKRWHKSCLALNFSQNGSHIITSSAQGGVKVHDMETRAQIYCQMKASPCAINVVQSIDEHRFITGDDDGMIKIWDKRDKTYGFSFSLVEQEQTDGSTVNASELLDNMVAINDAVLCADEKTLLVAMDDGTLTTVNVKRRRKEMKSEWLGFAAKSVATVKNCKKVIVGTDEGVISMYNYGEFGNICDRFPVVKCQSRGDKAIESIVKVTEDVVCVATDDGIIRVVTLLPNRVMDPLGCHKDDDDLSGGDCIKMSLNPAGTILASVTPASCTVRFWCVDQLSALAKEQDENLKLTKGKRKKSQELSVRKAMRLESNATSGFLSDLISPHGKEKEEETSDEEDDSKWSDSDSDSS